MTIFHRFWRDIVSPSDEGRYYAQNGYFIFRNALPLEAIRGIHAAIDRDIRPSKASFVRHPSNQPEPNRFVQDGKGNDVLANALIDPHRTPETKSVADAVLNLVCTDAMADRLRALDGEDAYTLHQVIVFFVPPGTDPHVDGWGLDTDPAGFAHTLWIPLEPVNLRNGPIVIFPWPRGKYLSPKDLGIADYDPHKNTGARENYHVYHDALVAHLHAHHPDCVLPQLSPGDLVVFTSLTPHGTLPFHPATPSRMALQVLIRPSRMRWGGWPWVFEGESADPHQPRDKMVKLSSRWRCLV